MNTNNNDVALLQKAIKDAFDRKYDRELMRCNQSAQHSISHEKKMMDIIKNGSKDKKTRIHKKKRAIIGLLIAAALLLAGCATYIYRNEIREFIEECHKRHIKVTFSDKSLDGYSHNVNDQYVFTCADEGYVLVDAFRSSVYSAYKWENASGHSLKLEQCGLDGADFILDIETGATEIIEYDICAIYYRATDTHTYIWNNGRHAFQLISSVPLARNTIIAFVENTIVN